MAKILSYLMKLLVKIAAVLLGVLLSIAILILAGVLHGKYQWNQRTALLDSLKAQKDSIVANPTGTHLHDVFRESLHAKDDFERSNAAAYVRQFGEASIYFVDDLIRLLDDPSGYVRRTAASSLSTIGRPAKAAIPALIRAMDRYPGHSVSHFAADALGKMANRDDTAVIKALIRARDYGDETLYHSAIGALTKLGYEDPPKPDVADAPNVADHAGDPD